MSKSYPVDKDGQYIEPYHKPTWFNLVAYDLLTWFLTICFSGFFREIRPRGAFRIPATGPVIFVAAPHANQFVDAGLLFGQVKKEVDRRISFLIADKSMSVNGIKQMAKLTLSIPVKRAQDNLKTATGEIILDKENPLKIIGFGTKFTEEAMVKGLIGLPNSKGNTEIAEIISDTELVLKREFKKAGAQVLQNKTRYKLANKINQREVYEKVFSHLAHGECIGIFPEGGSHDRTDLLPLKAGVAIMALGAMQHSPGTDVKIVPCGMNYFHPHKFRSRCVIEFGHPISIPKELMDKYNDPKTSKEAIGDLLATIENGLRAVTVTCPDYETLMVVQAARRLYINEKTIPIPLVVEMNRRLVKGYQHYKDEPEVIALREKILDYNNKLKALHLPDHVVDTAKIDYIRNIGILIQRSVKLLFLFLLTLPGAVLFAPVFVVGKLYSSKVQREALAASVVKVRANDVVATWKILIAMGLAPVLYIFYSCVGLYIFRDSDINKIFLFFAIYMSGVAVTWSAVAFGDTGMDLLKSIYPICLSLVKPEILVELKNTRNELKGEIVEMVNRLGPQLFPDFDDLKENGVDEILEDKKTEELRKRRRERRRRARHEESSDTSDAESISNASLFASSDAESDISETSLESTTIGEYASGVSLKVVDALRERRTILDEEEK
jgi:glycerol-3-phosphate O-acyltransferase/dihydroxyacetone phosphate acyltransferase